MEWLTYCINYIDRYKKLKVLDFSQLVSFLILSLADWCFAYNPLRDISIKCWAKRNRKNSIYNLEHIKKLSLVQAREGRHEAKRQASLHHPKCSSRLPCRFTYRCSMRIWWPITRLRWGHIQACLEAQYQFNVYDASREKITEKDI